MTLLNSNKRAAVFVCALALASVFSLAAGMSGQTLESRLPQSRGHVNDFAGVIDGTQKERLESILVNLKRRAGIQFVIATVKTVGDRTVREFALQLSRDWGIGSRTSTQKSLLLLIVVEDSKFFILSSKGVESDLPEGLMAEVVARMRPQIKGGNYGEGLLAGIQTFANTLGKQLGFSFEALDRQAAGAVALQT